MVYNPKDNNRADQTVVRPTPGGRPSGATLTPGADATSTQDFYAQPQQPAASPQYGQQPNNAISDIRSSRNPIVSASGNIFSLLNGLRNLPSPPADITVIRHQFVQLISTFEKNLQQHGIDQDTIIYARYGICSTVDEIILNTPWGGRSIWSTNSLLSTYHRETLGGEHFFTILEKTMADVERYRNILELFFVCLNFGFKGKLRIDPQGDEKHHAIMDRLYQSLYHGNPLTQNPLSVHWHGLNTGKRRFSWEFPIWVVFSVAACIVLGAYLYFQHSLHTARTPTLVQLENLLTPQPAQVTAEPEVDSLIPAPISQPEIEDLFKAEIEQGILAVTTLDQDAKLTVWNAFASGSAKTSSTYAPIIQKIAYVLQSRPGTIVVAGHTDNIPIKSTQYPTNWHLSLARATAVSQQLNAYPQLSGRIQTEGFGDKYPIADNTTAEGRAKNRRIEIILLGESI